MLEEIIQSELQRTGAPSDYNARERVKEYVTAVDNGRPLVADGLQEGYRIICEYGRYVLAGMKYRGSEAAHGYQFATWEYSPDKSGVAHGHYYPTWSRELGTNALEAAKEDFAVRSGLVQEEKLFTPEQFKDIQHALHYYSDECSTISADTYESIRSIIRQIGHAVPASEPIQEPMQEPTMDM